MATRMAIWLSAVFWVTMNVLLWRSEYGGLNHQGSAVPPEVVWKKIVTSPDSSSLDILHHGRKAGYARWSASERHAAGSVARVVTGGLPTTAPTTGYRLDLEGNLVLDGTPERLHFEASLELATNHVWRQMDVRISQRTNVVAVHSKADEQLVRLRMESGRDQFEQVYTFAELQDPRTLVEQAGLPLPLAAFGIPELALNSRTNGAIKLDLPWEASSVRMNIGHTITRAYRLQARLLDRWQVVVMVSPVGEILRVELPDDWVLTTDEAGNF